MNLPILCLVLNSRKLQVSVHLISPFERYIQLNGPRPFLFDRMYFIGNYFFYKKLNSSSASSDSELKFNNIKCFVFAS